MVEKALRIANEIADVLRNKKFSFSLYTAYWPDVWDGFTEVWLVGGDGTVNFFINRYPDFKLPIALFAGGTGNDLHATLYGKQTIAQQIETFSKAHIQWIDAGVCNGKIFLNGIGIGFDGAVVKHLLNKQKRSGKTSYLLSILKQIFSYGENRCTLTYDDVTLQKECFMISVANGARYGGGFQVAPNASVTDGLLDVMVVEKVSTAARLRYLPVIEKGKHLHLPFVKYHQTKQVTITSTKALPAHRDGEYFSDTRFEIHVLEKAFAFLR